MPKKVIYRDRISPNAVFEDKLEELAATFIDRVGKLFYGNEWTEQVRQKLNAQEANFVAGSDSDVASTVRDQVITGLRHERFTAFIWLTASVWALARQAPTSDNADNFSIENGNSVSADPGPDPLWGEDITPKRRQFIISVDYWNLPENEIDVDWLTSTISIPTSYLRDISWGPRRDLSILDTYNVGPIARNVPLRILYPHRALRDIVKYEDVADKDWYERYIKYRREARFEALAVMWRYLAILGPSGNMIPSAKALAQITLDYLAIQGWESSGNSGQPRARDSGLEEMAAHILQQFEDNNLTASVLVSSNPRTR